MIGLSHGNDKFLFFSPTNYVTIQTKRGEDLWLNLIKKKLQKCNNI